MGRQPLEKISSDATNMILRLLDARSDGATVCPSEVARALAAEDHSDDWRGRMSEVHDKVDQMLKEKRIALSWKGRALVSRNGPYRIRRSLLD